MKSRPVLPPDFKRLLSRPLPGAPSAPPALANPTVEFQALRDRLNAKFAEAMRRPADARPAAPLSTDLLAGFRVAQALDRAVSRSRGFWGFVGNALVELSLLDLARRRSEAGASRGLKGR